jgi:hypothetical protein
MANKIVNNVSTASAILTEQLEWPLDINFGGSCHGRTGLNQLWATLPAKRASCRIQKYKNRGDWVFPGNSLPNPMRRDAKNRLANELHCQSGALTSGGSATLRSRWSISRNSIIRIAPRRLFQYSLRELNFERQC